MKYEIKQILDHFEVYLYNDDGELISIQSINPDTGDFFRSREEALAWLKDLYPDLVKEEEPVPTFYVKARFYDSQDQEKTIFKVGDSVKLKVSVHPVDENGQPIEDKTVPVQGKYIVPYNYQNQPLGLLLLEFNNGVAEKTFTAQKSGVYEVKLDEIYDADTKEPLKAKLIVDVPRVFVVDA